MTKTLREKSVRDQLDKIRRHFTRHKSRANKRFAFLASLVECNLNNHSAWVAIKEHYPRTQELTDENPRKMRDAARNSLEAYYDDAGKRDPLVIRLPSVWPTEPVHYIPIFDWRDPDAEGSEEGRSGKSTLNLAAGASGETTLPTRNQQLRYLERLIEDIENLGRLYSPMRGKGRMRAGGHADPGRDPWKKQPQIQRLRYRTRQRSDNASVKPSEYDDVLEAFEEVQQAVVLGAPGAGKSTVLRRLALDLAERAAKDKTSPLPLFANLGDWTGDESFSAFLSKTSEEIGWTAVALSHAGRLVLILDELNQMPPAKRGKKAQQILEFKKTLHEHTPIYLSCRLDDHVDELDLELDTLTLEPLSPRRVRAALRQWETDFGRSEEDAERIFWQLAGDEKLAAVFDAWIAKGGNEDAFWSDGRPSIKLDWRQEDLRRRHVRDQRSLLKLASNPFMLTMFYGVSKPEAPSASARDLPRNKGDLFRKFIDCLLGQEGLLETTGRRERTSGGDRLVAGLKSIAWRMQSDRIAAGAGDDGDFGVLPVVPRRDALKLVDGNRGLLKKALDASLLEGEETLRFRHQLLQEYFTAQALESRLDEMSPKELWPPAQWWKRSGWEEACVLLAGFYQSDCTPVIRWLAEDQPEVAAQCILESGAEIADREGLLHELREAWMPRLTDTKREPQPEARAAVGRALGRLRFGDGSLLDDRKGVGLTEEGLPDIAWVEISGGEFVYQEGTDSVEAFSIARYPITNIQFQAFCEAKGGYDNDEWWEGMENPNRTREPGEWSESNHPCETVSWHEATAFCAWLSSRRGDKAHRVRLPTEREWERAARGVDGRRYPWGAKYDESGHANMREPGGRYLGQTSAVGIYPKGTAKERRDGKHPIHDLAGNVWEWCANEHENVDEIGLGGSQSRVVRGSSWDVNRDYVRAVDRFHYHPNLRFYYVGFRVVCSSPIR